ncbi:MAG: helix-turn-helix transcriptional regulator [Rhodospirillales bacterium]|nr:helix-turn-helix transcriptional regulator [Rhodospirillales bacterium]
MHDILRQWPSADRLARAMGVSPSAFRKWLKGEAEPSRERLVALASTAGVSVGWLATGEGEPPDLRPTSPGPGRMERDVPGLEEFVLLPSQDSVAAAGASPQLPSDPRGSHYMAFRNDWVREEIGIDPAAIALERAVGDSMAPTIKDGDILLLDTTQRAFALFGIYVLEVDGERLVKRVQRKLDGSLVLISDNPDYERDMVPAGRVEHLVAIGRVVWVGKKM